MLHVMFRHARKALEQGARAVRGAQLLQQRFLNVHEYQVIVSELRECRTMQQHVQGMHLQ
jgi:hypothetical protein